MSASTTLPPAPMTAEEFLDWTLDRPDDTKFELIEGEAVAIAPQTYAHVVTKQRIVEACTAEVRARGLPCRVLVDGMGVRASAQRLFMPDALVQCGPPIADDARIVEDPMVVIEVVSPSTRRGDAMRKLIGYFEIASVRHYLVVDPGIRRVVHHARDTDGIITARIHADEPIRLDPPGIVLAGVFPEPA